jgi:hypothetical protein
MLAWSVVGVPTLCVRGDRSGRDCRQAKNDRVNEAAGHDFRLCGHRIRTVVMDTQYEPVMPESKRGVIVGSGIDQFRSIHSTPHIHDPETERR